MIVSHSFAVAGLYAEPGLGNNSLGTLGVYIFFTISGLLVTKSWYAHPRATAFLGKRALRILPGLAAATLFVLLVVGPMLTSLSLRDYFLDPLTLKYLGNISMFDMSYNLPGVFTNNPFAGSTNGSLWTLAYEFVAYLGLAVIGYFGLIKHRAGLLRSFVYLVIGTYVFMQIFPNPVYSILDLQINYLIPNVAFFVMGSLFYLYRDEIRLSEPGAVAAFILVSVSPFLPMQWFIRLLALPYLITYLALMPTKYAHKFSRYGDFSYGMYIYAWPVQQVIAAVGHGHVGPLRLTLYAFPPILILAALSWHLIEKPSLKLKRRFSNERYPLDGMDPRIRQTSYANLKETFGGVMQAYSVSARLLRRHATWLLVSAIGVIGLIRTWLTYRLSFGLGDTSTFYIFARNTLHGEVIYKDFIHFRMPGFYYYCAAFLKLFGDSYASLNLAMSVEGFVLNPLAMFAASKLISGSNLLSGMVAAACMFASGIFQLRAGLGFLAVALYVAALRKGGRQGRWMVGTGAVLGLVFLEGQEVFLFAAASLGIVEVLTGWREWRATLGRLVRVAAGAMLVIGPFLVGMALFSNFSNFLYYTLKYALVIQPKYMNLPFPPFAWDNAGFYLPFALYILAVTIFWTTRRLSREVVIVLSFGVLRLATAMGRADIGHVVFSIPELFFIMPWALSGLGKFDRRRLDLRLLGVAIAMAAMFGVATRTSSAVLLLGPAILSGLYLLDRVQYAATAVPRRAMWWAVAVTAIGIVVIFHHDLKGAYYAMRAGAHNVIHGQPNNRISGVIVGEPVYGEITAVSNDVRALGAKTLFSYPIEPFYYSLMAKHPSRFITFEPQTTPAEVDEAIADLERTKPDVVILDMLQAEALSPSISRLSDYITDHYEVSQSVSRLDYIKVLKRKAAASLDRVLLLDLFAHNPKTPNLSSYHIDNKDGTITDAMKTGEVFSDFQVRVDQPAEFVAQVRSVPTEPKIRTACGVLEITDGTQKSQQTVCEGDPMTAVVLDGQAGRVAQIKLRSKDADQDVLWVNPTVRSTAK